MPISYARHRFPPEVIQRAVWLYLRFTLSYRDVEDLVAERGLDSSYETGPSTLGGLAVVLTIDHRTAPLLTARLAISSAEQLELAR